MYLRYMLFHMFAYKHAHICVQAFLCTNVCNDLTHAHVHVLLTLQMYMHYFTCVCLCACVNLCVSKWMGAGVQVHFFQMRLQALVLT